MSEEFYEEERMELVATGAAREMGAQALGEVWITPADEAMAHEEGRASAGAAVVSDRAEVFGRVMIYVLGGSLCPAVHGARLVALAREFGVVHSRWREDLAAMEERWPGEPASASAWVLQGLEEADYVPLGEVLAARRGSAGGDAVVRRLLLFFFAEGWVLERAVKRVWALAVALRPALVANYRLQGVADVWGETRAAVSARVRRVYSLPIEESGGCGHAWFQKSAGTVEKYRAAAKGNKNRKGTGRKAKHIHHEPTTKDDTNQ